MASQTLPALRKRGYDVEVVTSHAVSQTADYEERAGIRVHRFPVRAALASNDLDALSKIKTRIADLKRRFAPDLVHMNFAGPSMWLHFETARAHAAPLVIAFRGAVEHTPMADSLFEHAVDSASWTVGVSRAVLDSVVGAQPRAAARSSVIYNAFQQPSLEPAPLAFDPPRILCLGRLVEEKCFDVAVDAIAAVRTRFPRVELVIAGDGPERTRLQQRIVERGLVETTRFLGWVAPEAVPALLNEATMLVLPSRVEGLPGVAIQAAQMGRPVVATRVGGTPEVVEHGSTGLLAELGDGDGLATAIGTLVGEPERAAVMGVRARQRARSLFDWHAHVDAYDSLYRALA